MTGSSDPIGQQVQQFQSTAEALRLFAKLDCSLHTGILAAVDTDGDCAKFALNPVQLRMVAGRCSFFP